MRTEDLAHSFSSKNDDLAASQVHIHQSMSFYQFDTCRLSEKWKAIETHLKFYKGMGLFPLPFVKKSCIIEY